MNNLIINAVTSDQVDVLREISITTFKDTYEAKNDPVNFQHHLNKVFDKAQLLKELNSSESLFFFISNQGENYGYIKLNIGNAQTEILDGTYIELERIYVSPEHQGKGVGRKLIQFAIQKGKELGHSKMWLGVWDQNPEAILFYERLGFKTTGTHIFTIGSEDQTDYVMEIKIQ